MRLRITRTENKKQDKPRNWIAASFSAILVIWVANTWWPEVLAPFKTFGAPFWAMKGTVGEWLLAVWPIFAWGCGVNVVARLSQNTGYGSPFGRWLEPKSGEILLAGAWRSFVAGTLEELAFRWLLFLSAIVGVVFANWLWGTVFLYIFLVIIGVFLTWGVASHFGKDNILPALFTFLGCLVGIIALAVNGGVLNPIKWIYEIILLPIADWTSLGKMHDILYQPYSWALGAGVVSANAFFRDGHKYQGLFGTINAWFLGLVMFWTMFTYGLVAAIVVHFTYDFVIFATVAAMRKLGR